MKKDKHSKYWTILLSLTTTCILSLSLSQLSKKIDAQFGGGHEGYTCYLPEGETEIRDLIIDDSTHNGNYYKTRGTLTRIQKSETNRYRAFIQRTNGEDGSKSSLMLYDYRDPYFSVIEGNVIDVDGVYTYYGGNTPELLGYSNPNFYSATVVEESNPNPVEAWEMSVSEFNIFANSFTFRDMSRLVTIKSVKFANTVSGSAASYSQSIYLNNGIYDSEDDLEVMSLKISMFNTAETNAMPDILNPHIEKNAIFDLTGVITYLSGTSEFALMLVDADDVYVVSEDDDGGGQVDPPDNIEQIEVYAVNDFHGAIEETPDRAGLANFATFFKEKGEHDNTLLIDSGDSWQGSIYSNYNYGKLVTDVMNYAEFDARTVGNHDFDWGIEKLKANVARDYEGYTTPTLAANVYDFNFATKIVGSEQQSDLGQKSVTYTMENGLKVGIIGVIGQDQITSISSLYVQDIAFKNHVEVIKEEATALKADGVDIIIASVHSGQETVIGNDLGDYVDLVLCAHTHRVEEYDEDGLTFAQFGTSGMAFGRVTLEYDTIAKDVVNTEITNYSGSFINSEVNTVDATIADLIENSGLECDGAANEVVASNVTGVNFDSKNRAANLMCKAIFDQTVEEGIYVDLVYSNAARNSLNTGEWTFADIYEAFPFDNTVYIIDITGEEMLFEVKNYNNIYRNPNFTEEINPGDVYRIACLDYLAFHTNTSRYYDYFSDNNGDYVDLLEDNYRIILYNWLKANNYHDGEELNGFAYESSIWNYNRSYLMGNSSELTFYNNYDINDETIFDVVRAVKGSALSSAFPSPSPFRSGFNFAGWYLDPSGTSSISEDQLVDEAISLYAKWVPLGAEWDSLDYDFLSFSDIMTIGSGFQHNEKTIDSYYVQGRIDSIDSGSGLTNGNMYLSDQEGNLLYVYGLYFGSVKYGNMDATYKPNVGDIIIISGRIMKYNTITEMIESQLLARNGVLIS